MSRVLLVFASTHGHTAKVAAAIADRLGAGGHDVTTCAIEDAGDVDVGDFDAVVTGASIHHGAHQPEMVTWARRHAIALNARPSAFFSVCLAAAETRRGAHRRA